MSSLGGIKTTGLEYELFEEFHESLWLSILIRCMHYISPHILISKFLQMLTHCQQILGKTYFAEVKLTFKLFDI